MTGFDQYSQNIILSSGEYEAEKDYWLNRFQGEISESAFPNSPNNPMGCQYDGLVRTEYSKEVCRSLPYPEKNIRTGEVYEKSRFIMTIFHIW